MGPIEAFEALHSPAALRNKQPLLEAMTPLLPSRGALLELASGAMQHALHIAPHFPLLQWQCSELDQRVLALAPAYVKAMGARWPGNVQAPIKLDVAAEDWQQPVVDVIYSANLLHISPIAVTEGLFECAHRTLHPGGALLVYGPFTRNGAFQSESDAQFDSNLRGRNPQWGIRALERLSQLATASGFSQDEPIAMPANNWLLRFKKPLQG